MVHNFQYYVWDPYIEGYQFASALDSINLEFKDSASIAIGKSLKNIPEGIVFADKTPGPVPDVMSTGGSGLLVSAPIREVKR